MKDSDLQALGAEIARNKIGNRTESSALLAWFLDSVWRIEPEDIEDFIVDGRGDKGIDAIVLDEDAQEISVLQSKYRDRPGADQGDADVRKFMGVAAYFESADSVDQLLNSAPRPELRQLLTRLKIKDRIADGAHLTRLVFVTNGSLDSSGRDYVSAVLTTDDRLEVWDLDRLIAIAARTQRPRILPETVVLPSATKPTQLTLDSSTQIAVGFIPAEHLVTLPGIDDLSLFDLNVRLGLERTKIGREIGETIGSVTEHPLFPAYHNGLTVLTNRLEIEDNKMLLHGIAVVNGCQSLLALNRNRDNLSKSLQVLVKVVQVSPDSGLSDVITYRTNNQHSVDIRDQRSRDPVQRDLQTQMSEEYAGRLAFGIREGEQFGSVEVLDNRGAAQLIMAAFLGEPWLAVRKVRLFDEDYRRIFNRHISVHQLYLLHLIDKVVQANRKELNSELQASFASVRLALVFLLAEVLKLSKRGDELLKSPESWLPDQEPEVEAVLMKLARDIARLINNYVEKKEEEASGNPELDFDPKVVFKSKSGVGDLRLDLVSFSERQAVLDPNYLFEIEPR